MNGQQPMSNLMNRIKDPKEWVLATCNGRMYIGKLVEKEPGSGLAGRVPHVSDSIKVDAQGCAMPHEVFLRPCYEMIILSTSQGPMRLLAFPWLHPGVKDLPLPNPTLETFERLTAGELAWYEHNMSELEIKRDEELNKSRMVTLEAAIPKLGKS